MNEPQYYYADQSNTPVGPYTLGQLKQLHTSGQLTTSTYVLEEGTQDWKPFSSLISLPGASLSFTLPPAQPMHPERKSKLAGGLFGIFLGCLGVHNFYLGYTTKAVIQLLITVLTLGILSFVSAIWGLIEGILILSGSINQDAKGVPLRD